MDKYLLNAYLADLKSSCFSVCLRSFLIETKKQKNTPPTEGPTEKLYCYNSW